MTAEINFARLLRQLPELRTALVENRKMVLVPAAAIVGYLVLRDPAKNALHRFFAHFYSDWLLEDVNLVLQPFREFLGDQLASQKAQSPHSHDNEPLSILEIGMGPGSSLDFYPKDSRIVAVEPNPYFVDRLLKLQESHPNLVKVIHGSAEDLRDIPSESIDAVVSTLVLCSVSDLDKSIKEVKRVLVKGGRFYFFEHQACPKSWRRYLLQIVANPLWRIVFDGCNLHRQIHRQIEANGFEMDHAKLNAGASWYVCQAGTEGYVVKRRTLMMAVEVNFARFLQQLPAIRTSVIENRRMILIPTAAVFGYLVLRDPVKDGLDRFFAYIYNTYLLKDVNLALRAYREHMREELASQETLDPHSHNDESLRILEIGMGPGVNLDFYPANSRVIGVEPNPYFVDQLIQLQKSHRNFVKVIRGFAEDLRDISTESVDAVVATLVLCSVKDLDKSLKEVKRVLVKGGRFYFFEHQACQVSWKRYLLQIIANPFWKIVFDGCNLNRQTHRQIEANGFEMSHTKQSVGHMWYILRSTTEGYAVKE
ncbi:uncharacterized protein LOC100899743 [Galendromus occidentalis]|uniref:Uncharacterized protein LOC100899743 n=1 Tax=Galendromus occidentalis TaxID=34638 RepID=A0AAJ6QQH2_9ACAR|nr:uncharacterized protein LOC100899743 [Galendromus occidentalis]